MIHFVKDYRKRRADKIVVECDGCGATCDWTPAIQWIEVHRWVGGWRSTFHYCGDACFLAGAFGNVESPPHCDDADCGWCNGAERQLAALRFFAGADGSERR